MEGHYYWGGPLNLIGFKVNPKGDPKESPYRMGLPKVAPEYRLLLRRG